MLENSDHHKHKYHHLIIIFSCMLLQMFPFGMAQEVSPLFIRPLHNTFDFSITSIGFIFTIGSIVSSIASPFVGKLFEKWTTKWLMLGGVIISSLGILMNAFSSQLWQFYIANAIIQIGVITYSSLGIPYLIGQWFSKDEKPAALGFAFAGGAIGNFFWQPVISELLHYHPIQNVYFICAMISLLIGSNIILFMIKNHKNTTNHSAKQVIPLNSKGLPFSKVKHLSWFWILAISMLFLGINIAAQSSQYANYFSAIHLSSGTIGLIGSAFAMSALAGNIFGGILIVKKGLKTGVFTAFILQFISALSMVGLSFFKFIVLGFIWAFTYGLSCYIYMSGPAVIVQTLFGMKGSSQTLGFLNIFFAVGFATGNVIFGLLLEHFGFKFAWIIIVIFIIICYVSMLNAIHAILKKNYANIEI